MNPIKDWNKFWFTPRDVRNLGIFRIALGLTALIKLFLLLPVMGDFYTEEGMFSLAQSKEFVWPRLCLFDNLPLDIAPVFFAAMILISLLFTLGLWTRLISILMYVGMVSIEYRNPLIGNSGDRLLVILLFFGIFAPLGKAFSLDSRLKRENNFQGSYWAARFMQTQVCLMYFWSTYLKIHNHSWESGGALYWVSRNLERARWPLPSFVTSNMYLLNLLTYFTLLVEGLFPFAIWSKRTRNYIITAGILLHLGIEYTMNVQIFQLVTLSTYLLFYDGEEIASAGRSMRNFVSKLSFKNWRI